MTCPRYRNAQSDGVNKLKGKLKTPFRHPDHVYPDFKRFTTRMAKGSSTTRLVIHVNDALPFELSLAAFFDHAAEISRANRMESVFQFAEALELTLHFP